MGGDGKFPRGINGGAEERGGMGRGEPTSGREFLVCLGTEGRVLTASPENYLDEA